jgi:ATP phosphoribosyltransferase regulatory subunit
LLDDAGIVGSQRLALSRGLDRKDVAAVVRHGGTLADVLTDLLRSAGPADRALAALREAALPEPARALAGRLAETVAAIRARAPALRLTIDPVEFRGFRYHTGICVTVYAPGRREELGRGGRYVCGETEPATGLTLFPDAVLRAAPPRAPRARLFVPLGADPARATALRAEGFATVAALDAFEDTSAEAWRLRCTHVLLDGEAVALKTGG